MLLSPTPLDFLSPLSETFAFLALLRVVKVCLECKKISDFIAGLAVLLRNLTGSRGSYHIQGFERCHPTVFPLPPWESKHLFVSLCVCVFILTYPLESGISYFLQKARACCQLKSACKHNVRGRNNRALYLHPTRTHNLFSPRAKPCPPVLPSHC